jgi:alkaline phosphatase
MHPKRILRTLAAFFLFCAVAAAGADNVIMMIPDGMSLSGLTLARLVKGAPLALDSMASGLVGTWSSDGSVADSAPGGSAYSTGWSSESGNIATVGGIYRLPGAAVPPYEAGRPLATVLEAARLAGKATGMVFTCEFPNATPASFASHDPSRSNYDDISEQIIHNGLDVLLGGGQYYVKPSGRRDGEDLAATAAALGYGIVYDTAGLRSFRGERLMGFFARSPGSAAMSYDRDRDPVREPSLAEMTAKALSLLSRDADGFFLMVEGSKIDWAAHANDPAGMVSEILAFDEAVGVALAFAQGRKDTIVVAAADHGNSGISIGDRSTSANYSRVNWSVFAGPIAAAKVTGEGLEAKMPAGWPLEPGAQGPLDPAFAAAVRDAVAVNYGIRDLGGAELESIARAKRGSLMGTVGPMLAARAKIGFTSNGHTGEDVVLFTFDPGPGRLTGYVHNTDVGRYLALRLGVDLAAVTERLYADAGQILASRGAVVRTDFSDPLNPVFVASLGGRVLRAPRNWNLAFLDGQPMPSDGVNVYNGKKWYLSSQLLDLLK